MTICIAAVCQTHDGNPTIILCSDHRIENEYYGGEVAWKIQLAGGGWCALIAGEMGKAKQLITACHACLDAPSFMDEPDTIFDELKKCAQQQRRVLVNDFVESKLSISYEEFLAIGSERLPEDVYRQLLWDIQTLTLGCEIILAGFVDQVPYLFLIDNSGIVTERAGFAAIGAGAVVAEGALFQRRYATWLLGGEAMYYVYEAKRLSEIAPGVGIKTAMAVVQPGADGPTMLHIGDGGVRFLEKQYAKFGLKRYEIPKRVPGRAFWYGNGAVFNLTDKRDLKLTKPDPKALRPSQE